MRVAVIPGVLALLPEYAATTDPVPDLRAACRQAADWLGSAPTVVADPQGERVAAGVVRDVFGVDRPISPQKRPGLPHAEETYLVVLNGSARRTEQSPGPYDPRAVGFDDGLGEALTKPDPTALKELDHELAGELWAATAAVPQLAELLTGPETVTVDYAAAPYGVQYWVLRYER